MPMMAGIQLEGTHLSGWGVEAFGFHTPTLEFPKKLSEYKSSSHRCVISQCESNGYISLVVFQNLNDEPIGPVKLAHLRREPHKFFVDLGPLLRKLQVAFVVSATLSESYGSISLTFAYAEPLKVISV